MKKKNKLTHICLCMVLTLLLAFLPTNTQEVEAGQNAIDISHQTMILYPKQSKTITLTIGGGKYTNNTWKSSNPKVAVVSKNGKVTAVAPGKATISVYPNPYPFAVCKCTISVKAPSISLNKNKANLSAGDSLTLKAKIKGASKKITWKSSNPKIAAVNSKGVVKSRRKGTVYITAYANGKKAQCKIKVTS